jgi:putative tricarboxylic transport membrane protein
MRRADLVVAILLLGGGLVVVGEGLRLGTGWSTDGPEPGFFIFYLGVALALASAAVAAQAMWASDPPLYRKSFVASGQFGSVLKVAGPAALLVGLTHWIGLYVAGAVYLAAYMRWIGRHSWALTVPVSLGIPVVTFLIFEVWFLVPMPKGPLEAFLGF